jgi:hypothetical protein
MDVLLSAVKMKQLVVLSGKSDTATLPLNNTDIVSFGKTQAEFHSLFKPPQRRLIPFFSPTMLQLAMY